MQLQAMSWALFTDGSLNPQRGIGIGIALLVPEGFLETESKRIDSKDVAARAQHRRFEDTSSTQLEVQTAIWAVEEFGAKSPLTLHTDSQNVVGLSGRRQRLESTNYISKQSGKPIRHAELYRQYFALTDRCEFTVRKVSGHSDYRYQDTVHRIFHYVDREARRLLKQWLRELER